MTCGLFDTGFAGSAADVTSLDFGVADIDQSLFTYQDAGSSSYGLTDNNVGSSYKEIALSSQALTLNTEQSPAFGLDDWSLDMLDPLGGLEDPLADSSLDAFVNLDSFFMGDNSLFDNGSQPHVIYEAVEVKPVIDFDALDLPSVVTENFFEPTTIIAAAVAKPNKVSRKRKVSAVETSMFKVPEIILEGPYNDHDYVPECEGENLSFEIVEKKKGKKTTPKRRRVSSTASVDSEVSSTSCALDFEHLDVKSQDKTTVRRIKNNIASKRSREQKKNLLSGMDEEAEQLIVANAQLKIKIVELEQMAKEMKEKLVAKMAGSA